MSSISISGLCWSSPNHDTIFDKLDLTIGSGRTGLVGRNGTGKTTLLRLIAGALTPDGGTVTVPGSVGYLRQDQPMSDGATIAHLFDVVDDLAVLQRAERGQATADDLARADWTLEARLRAALDDLGLDQPPDTPVARLSGGQRTRASLAALLFAQPDVLLLDEPTNHLDCAGRAFVAKALRGWKGCVLVASHDRTLLEEMDAIVELTSLGAATVGGNYSAYRAAKDAALTAAAADLARAERAVTAGRARAQQATERKARTDRQGRQLRAAGSQPKMLMDAQKERSEGSAGSAARLHARHAEEAAAALDAARERVEVLEPLLMDVPTSGLPPGREALQVDDIRFGYDAQAPVFCGVSLMVRGPERVAIDGANGVGKSTFLACIHGQLQPQAGRVSVNVPAALIDQDLSLLNPNETVTEAFARIDPTATENARRAVLARFLFRGTDAEQRIKTLSGGQKMRAGLACTLGHSQRRQLLLLDEPSNHLDIEAVETLEAALRAYDGALLVVSHDQAFLDRIGVTRRFAL